MALKDENMKIITINKMWWNSHVYKEMSAFSICQRNVDSKLTVVVEFVEKVNKQKFLTAHFGLLRQAPRGKVVGFH